MLYSRYSDPNRAILTHIKIALHTYAITPLVRERTPLSAPYQPIFLAIAQRQEPMGTHRHVVLRGAGPAGGSQIGGRMYFVDKGISSDPTDLHSVHPATYLFKVC